MSLLLVAVMQRKGGDVVEKASTASLQQQQLNNRPKITISTAVHTNAIRRRTIVYSIQLLSYIYWPGSQFR